MSEEKTSDCERDYHYDLLDAHLRAVWMSRCGPSGVPGRWLIPGEFLRVLDDAVGVELYPSYAVFGPFGEIVGWSPHLLPAANRTEAWEWRFWVGRDDLEESEVAALEALGGCFDDYHVDFVVLGAHQERPPITAEVVEALALLQEGA